jgi:hypothetical protein
MCFYFLHGFLLPIMVLSCVSIDHNTRIMQSQQGPELEIFPECPHAEVLQARGGLDGSSTQPFSKGIWKNLFQKKGYTYYQCSTDEKIEEYRASVFTKKN